MTEHMKKRKEIYWMPIIIGYSIGAMISVIRMFVDFPHFFTIFFVIILSVTFYMACIVLTNKI